MGARLGREEGAGEGDAESEPMAAAPVAATEPAAAEVVAPAPAPAAAAPASTEAAYVAAAVTEEAVKDVKEIEIHVVPDKEEEEPAVVALPAAPVVQKTQELAIAAPASAAPAPASKGPEKEPLIAKPSSKDERDFRPSSVKEMLAAQNYKPYVLIYSHSSGEKVEYNVGCWLNCQDIGIICACFVALWSILLGIYTLLLKAALDTDESSTAMFLFLGFGILFTLVVTGSVFMNGVEETLAAKYAPVDAAEKA